MTSMLDVSPESSVLESIKETGISGPAQVPNRLVGAGNHSDRSYVVRSQELSQY
jgi:hypothetical protein